MSSDRDSPTSEAMYASGKPAIGFSVANVDGVYDPALDPHSNADPQTGGSTAATMPTFDDSRGKHPQRIRAHEIACCVDPVDLPERVGHRLGLVGLHQHLDRGQAARCQAAVLADRRSSGDRQVGVVAP